MVFEDAARALKHYLQSTIHHLRPNLHPHFTFSRFAEAGANGVSSGVISFRSLCAAGALALVFPACTSVFRDDSHFVPLGDSRGYYVLQVGSPLAVKLGYPYPPTNNTGDPMHRGYGDDAIAFRLSRDGVLIAPPAYFSQMPADTSLTTILSRFKVGVTTWSEIDHALPYPNAHRRAPGDTKLIYKVIAVYNPMEDDDTD